MQDTAILNIDNIQTILERRQELFPGEDIEIKLQDEKIGSKIKCIKSNFDNVRSVICELAKNFPHRCCVVSYSFVNQMIKLEVHPVTESA